MQAFTFQVSRGSKDPKNQGTSSLLYHMRKKHPEFDIYGKGQAQGQAQSDDPSAAAPISQDKRKRVAEDICIFNVRSKKERVEMFKMSIPDWIQASTMMDANSPRAQMLDKYV